MSEEIGDLLARLRAATNPDRWLDVEIARAVGADLGHAAGMHDALLAQPYSPVRRYTASVDAALTLVPEGCDWSVDGFAGSGRGQAYLVTKDDDEIERQGATPALALCIAALEARRAGGGA